MTNFDGIIYIVRHLHTKYHALLKWGCFLSHAENCMFANDKNTHSEMAWYHLDDNIWGVEVRIYLTETTMTHKRCSNVLLFQEKKRIRRKKKRRELGEQNKRNDIQTKEVTIRNEWKQGLRTDYIDRSIENVWWNTTNITTRSRSLCVCGWITMIMKAYAHNTCTT